jgi:chromate reductase
MKTIKTGVFVGSLRKESFSKKIALAFSSFMPDTFEMRFEEIGGLQMFNQDYDDKGPTPVEWQEFRREVKSLDGFLFVTPEYNRAMPAVLKNALDIASRPNGQNVWNGKPGAIIGVSPGKLGAFGASQQFRQTMSFLNIFLMQQPEIYIGDVEALLDKQGEIAPQDIRDFIRDCADNFARWIANFLAPRDYR